jgi:predicted RNase H-like HicB family nuclease
MQLRLRFSRFERDAEGFYVSCPPFQGCYSQGNTYVEALSNIKYAIRLHLEDRQADHDELAEPKSFSLSTVEISVCCRGCRGLPHAKSSQCSKKKVFS